MNTKKNLFILLGYSLILIFIFIFTFNINKHNTTEGFEITLDDINNLKQTDQDLQKQIQDLQQKVEEIKKTNDILPKKVANLYAFLNMNYNYI